VSCVLPSVGRNHLLCIPVVGGDHEDVAMALARLVDPPDGNVWKGSSVDY
jgi:hypothetical protein